MLHYSLSHSAPGFDELAEGSVIGLFSCGREKTARQFPATQMVLDAFTADSAAAAGTVGTGAVFHVIIDVTFYHFKLHNDFS